MTELKKDDLNNEKYKYSWKVSAGDNPKLIHDDANHLSRKEGYEMLLFLNNLNMSEDKTQFVYGKGSNLKKEALLHIEKIVKEDFKSTAPGRGTVVNWINDNWKTLRGNFAALEAKKK